MKNYHFFSQHILIENPRPEKENIIKDVRNLFSLEKLEKETIDTAIKEMRNIFRLEKEKEEVNDRTLTNIRNVFRLQREVLEIF